MKYYKPIFIVLHLFLAACAAKPSGISTEPIREPSRPKETLIAFENITIGEGSVIDGNVSVILPEGTGSGPFAYIELPSFGFIEPGRNDVAVGRSGHLLLAPGNYGKVDIQESSGEYPTALTLEGGNYHMEELDIGAHGSLQCMKPCDIRIMGRFLTGPYASVGNLEADADDVRIYVGGFNSRTGELFEDPESVVIGEESKVAVRMYSPNSTLVINDDAELEGSLIARNVRLGNRVRVTGIPAPRVVVARPILKSGIERDTDDITIIEGETRAFRLNPSVRIDAGKIFTVYGADLGLGPDDKMVLRASRRSDTELIYHQFQQFYKGLPVLGTGFSVSEKDGRAVSAVGKVARIIDINTEPSIMESEALQAALEAVHAEVYEWETPDSKKPPDGILAIASKDYTMKPGSFRLVYRFRINSLKPYGSETVDIDARTGEVTGRFGNVVTAAVESEGDTIFNGHQKFTAESFDENGKTRYRLRVPVSTGQAAISTKQRPSVEEVDKEKDFVSDVNKFNSYPLSVDSGGIIVEPKLYGVTIHWSLQKIGEYWKQFNWIGVDKDGKAEIKAIKTGNDPCDGSPACYDGGVKTIIFGDEKKIFGEVVNFHLVGHEYTHAIYDRAAEAKGDTVVNNGETWIINEGLADLLGWLVYRNDDIPYCTYYAPEHSITTSTSIGNDSCDAVSKICTKKYNAVCNGRDLSNPKIDQQPDFYKGLYYIPAAGVCDSKNDYCHHNSSIIPYWFYLLNIGAKGVNELGNSFTVPGIGREKAEKIVVNTLLYLLTGAADFQELRAASVQAAKDLYGGDSQESISVINAWYAVGLGDKYDTRTYSPQNVSGVDPWPVTLKWVSLKGEYDWQVQVSPDPLFKTEVKTLKPGASFSQMTVPGNPITWITSKVDLKPVTKYYWRVRSKVVKKASITSPGTPGTVTGTNKIWVPAGTKQVITVNGPVSVGNIVLAPHALEKDWGEWGAVQGFATGPKVPKINSPGPKYSSAAVNNTANHISVLNTGFLFLAGGGSGSQEPSAPKGPIIATGKYYPWSTEFTWESVPGAKEYRLTVSEDPGKKCTPPSGSGSGVAITSILHTAVRIVPDDTKSGGIAKHEVALKNGDTYYWWLQVYGPEGIAGGCAYGGAPVKFETSIPKAELLAPANGAKVSPFKVTLEWKEVKGATGYMLERAKGAPTFTEADELTGNTSTFSVSETGKYYWRVTPLGPKFPPLPAADIGAVSGTRYFTADLSLTKPELELPANNGYEPFGAKSVLFVWHPVEGAESYKLTVYERNADKSAGAQVSLDTGGYVKCTDNVRLCQNVNNVNVNKNGYCWKVAATGPGGLTGADSDLWCYNIGASRPAIVSPSKDQTGVEYNPVQFVWTGDYSPVGYRIEIFEDTQQEGVVEIFDQKIGQVNQYSKVLKPDTHHIWHIINLNPDGSAASDGGGFKTKMKPKPEETCKTLVPNQDVSNPSIQITYPPSFLEGDVYKPLYVLWQVNDPSIKEYQIGISSFNPYPSSGQPIESLIYTSNPIPASTMTSGSLANYQVPFWVQNLNYKFYKVYVYARTGSSCSWTLLDLVTFGVH